MKQLTYYILLSFILMFTICPVYAQNKRLEIPVRLGIDDMYMAPAGKKGLVVFNKSRQSVGKGLVEYIFRKYDQNLTLEWTVKSTIKRKLPLINYTYSANTLYLLFGKPQNRNYQVLKVNANAGFAEKFEFFFLDRLKIHHLAAFQNDLYVGGLLQGEPSVLHVNLILKKTKILSLNFKGKAYVESIYLDTLNNFVNATVVSTHYGETKVLLKSYLKGKEVRNITLPNEEDKYLQDAQVISTQEGEQLVVALYSRHRELKAHQGLFIARLTPENKLKSKQYYSFNNLKNFYGHLNEAEQKRIHRKISKRKKRGRKDYPVQSKMLLHKIVKHKEQYLVSGEMYFESVRMPGGAFFTPRSFPRNPLPREWEYSRMIGVGLTKTGVPKWDNVIKLKKVKMPRITPLSVMYPGGDSSRFVYYYDDQLHDKTFVESRGDNEVRSEDLKTLDKDDIIRENLALQVQRWYNKFYLLWGYQRIKNKRTGRRKVFFVQKMDFELK